MTLGLVLTPYGKVPGAYPWEIAKSAQGFETFYCPMDPQYFQRGEYGYYYDTPLGATKSQSLFSKLRRLLGLNKKNGLGAIPTDAEIGKHYYSWYTPVQSAWIYAADPKRYIPSPWVPPDNWNEASPYGPDTSLNGITLPHRGKRGAAFAGTHISLLGDSPGSVPPPTSSDAPNQPTVQIPPTDIIASKPATTEDIVRILNEYHQKQFTLSALATAAGVAASAFAIFRTVKGIQDDVKEKERRAALAK